MFQDRLVQVHATPVGGEVPTSEYWPGYTVTLYPSLSLCHGKRARRSGVDAGASFFFSFRLRSLAATYELMVAIDTFHAEYDARDTEPLAIRELRGNVAAKEAETGRVTGVAERF